MASGCGVEANQSELIFTDVIIVHVLEKARLAKSVTICPTRLVVGKRGEC
jgi:hypothetical protein